MAWVDGVLMAWDEVASGREVAAVTVSAMVPSLCGVDDTGMPVTPGVLYGDKRGRDSAVGDGVGGEVVGFARALAGAPGVAALWPAQAVANHALCGAGAIDTSTAMTMSPLFTGTDWDPRPPGGNVLDHGSDADLLSPGTLPIGARGPTQVSGGTIDALAEQMVADAKQPGDVMVICGTTLIPWALTDDWFEVEGLWTIPYSVPGVIAIGGASNAGGLFIDRVRAVTGDPDQQRVLDVGPDDRPLWLPYVRGERTPFHDASRRAELLHFNVAHGADEVLAAAYDAGRLRRPPPSRSRRTGARSRGHTTAPDRCRRRGNSGPGMDAGAGRLHRAPGRRFDSPGGRGPSAPAFTSRLTAGLETDSGGSRSWSRISHRVEPRAAHAEAAHHRYAQFREAADR